MVKITLYNSGELKEVVFIIIFYTSFVLTVCIPNISKEPKEDVYLEYSAYTPPTGTAFKAYHPATSYDIRFSIQHLLFTHHRV